MHSRGEREASMLCMPTSQMSRVRVNSEVVMVFLSIASHLVYFVEIDRSIEGVEVGVSGRRFRAQL